MFKIFSQTETPTKSHNRSKTLPYLHSSSESAKPSRPATTIVNGHQFQIIDPKTAGRDALSKDGAFTQAPLAEPVKSHQRTLTEQIRRSQDLPPLLTPPSESSFHNTSAIITPSSSHYERRLPSEHSQQSSPTRTQCSSLSTTSNESLRRIDQQGVSRITPRKFASSSHCDRQQSSQPSRQSFPTPAYPVSVSTGSTESFRSKDTSNTSSDAFSKSTSSSYTELQSSSDQPRQSSPASANRLSVITGSTDSLRSNFTSITSSDAFSKLTSSSYTELQSSSDQSRQPSPACANRLSVITGSKTSFKNKDAQSKSSETFSRLNRSSEQSQKPSTHKDCLAEITGSNDSLKSKDTSGISSETSSRLSAWFQGQSQPVSIGFIPSPVKEQPNPFDTFDMPFSPNSQTSKFTQRKPTDKTITTTTATKPTMASRFPFFNKKSPKAAPLSAGLEDEFTTLELKQALPDYGALTDLVRGNPRLSVNFSLLYERSQDLLFRMQAAYKKKVTALHESTQEQAALAEEKEAAVMNSRRLKLQLDGMSTKLEEQDEAIILLVNDLAEAKAARREAEAARREAEEALDRMPPLPAVQARPSAPSAASNSTTTSPTDVSTVFDFAPGSFDRGAWPPSTPATSVPASACGSPVPTTGCGNCAGRPVGEARAVAEGLKEEMKRLKVRTEELEEALNGGIELSSNVWQA